MSALFSVSYSFHGNSSTAQATERQTSVVTYTGQEWVGRNEAASAAEVLHFLLGMLLHLLQLSYHVEPGVESFMSGLAAPTLGVLNLELLLAPKTDLVDERGAGLDLRELFNEPSDIFRIKVLFHDALEKERVRGSLAEPKHVDQPVFAFNRA
jgi:hypothetical protein